MCVCSADRNKKVKLIFSALEKFIDVFVTERLLSSIVFASPFQTSADIILSTIDVLPLCAGPHSRQAGNYKELTQTMKT
eukprot:6198888-Pleurochrysis_carterae.AAC.2